MYSAYRVIGDFQMDVILSRCFIQRHNFQPQICNGFLLHCLCHRIIEHPSNFLERPLWLPAGCLGWVLGFFGYYFQWGKSYLEVDWADLWSSQRCYWLLWLWVCWGDYKIKTVLLFSWARDKFTGLASAGSAWAYIKPLLWRAASVVWVFQDFLPPVQPQHSSQWW